MHQPIKDNLEEFLKGSGEREISPEFATHLASCRACADEIHMIQQQAQMLRVLQPAADLEPRPGFYARVMERIEKQAGDSFWSIFLEPTFGRRLAIASAALVLLLGTYLISTEPGDQGLTAAPAVAEMQSGNSGATAPIPENASSPGPDSIQQQRDAVLVNLASYQE